MFSENLDWKPRVDLEFEDLEEAWQFCKEYGKRVGFGVRKQFKNKWKKDGCINFSYTK